MIEFVFLAVVFQFKHFFADYPLQNSFMLKKFLPGREFILPLAAHAGVHALFTLFIALLVNHNMWWVCILDFIIHFCMDRVKASPDLLGKYKVMSGNEIQHLKSMGVSDRPQYKEKIEGNKFFWWSLGADQMVHHLTHYGIIMILLGA